MRDALADASKHIGAKLVHSEDIKNFFPSIQSRFVNKVWQGLCGFPEPVASILTRLTTWQGCLVQGTHTSPYIASAVFWAKEPALENRLRRRGYTYSRYVDNINISSTSRPMLNWVRSQLYGMWTSYELQPKRSKSKIATSGNRQNVHGYNLNSGRPTVPKEFRHTVRAAIHKLGAEYETKLATVHFFGSKARA
jgi:hypothetical protein